VTIKIEGENDEHRGEEKDVEQMTRALLPLAQRPGGENKEREESEDEGEDDVEDEAEQSEGRRPKIKRGPKEPTKEDILKHEVTHTPFRSWCPACVKARGKASHHRAAESEEKGVATIHIDYWFMRDGRG